MLLLTIGIIVLGLAGIGTSFFWHITIREIMMEFDEERATQDQRIEKILKSYETIIEKKDEQEKRLLLFIDKNINERVVYTHKDEGYDNVIKTSESIEMEEVPQDEDEVQELDASQLQESRKNPKI